MSISGPSRLHSTFRYMISSVRFSAAFVNTVMGVPFPFRNPMPSRYSAFVAAPSTTLETVLDSFYVASVSVGVALDMAATISAIACNPS